MSTDEAENIETGRETVTSDSADDACLSSRELFCATNTVHIEHNGELYCLRLTRNNKLILTK